MARIRGNQEKSREIKRGPGGPQEKSRLTELTVKVKKDAFEVGFIKDFLAFGGAEE